MLKTPINIIAEALAPNETLRKKWQVLQSIISRHNYTVVACSGGVDSILLSLLVNQAHKENSIIFHAISPAVPNADTERVKMYSQRYGWNLLVQQTGEFNDVDYLRNPVDRCFYCKSHLYKTIRAAVNEQYSLDGRVATVFSGANTDDLGEYRPGLIAAKEHNVIHPYVNSEMSKKDIREISRLLGLDVADLPASPCLASRIYTGTPVTADRLRAVYFAESQIKQKTHFKVVRCRIRGEMMLIELLNSDLIKLGNDVVGEVKIAVRDKFPFISDVLLEVNGYKPGRAFVKHASTNY